MKKRFIVKFTALIMSLLMFFSLCACDEVLINNSTSSKEYPKNGEKKIISVTKDLYSPNGQTEPFNVAYYENEEDVLLVELQYAVNKLLNEFTLAMAGNSNSVSIIDDDNVVTLIRDNESYCELDFVKDTVYFSDFDYFSAVGYKANPHDALCMSYVNAEGKKEYFDRRLSFFTPGYSIEIDLAEREIPLDVYDGKKYIPLQTFNDLFVCPFGVNIAYNGENLFVLVGNTISNEVASVYYGREVAQRSNALTEFNYNELCLFLDLHYGLKAEHGFNDGFDYYLESIGLKDEFLKPDAINSFNALGTLTLGYISDLHSTIVGASPYIGEPNPSEGKDIKVSASYIDFFNLKDMYSTARLNVLGEEISPYQKVGNTAFITLDEFTFSRIGDYETDCAQPLGDTIAIISAIHQLITADSEIENVVLDLSCNTGGTADSAIYTIAWMLGYCDLSIYDSITESKSTITYKADVNFDYEFDEEDSISDKNLYCLISPVSFSSANLVPALLKASGKATIVGRASSGGSCVVRNAVTADGSTFCISGSQQLATIKNGTYYTVDQGVVPDVILTKIESFYNRVELVEYLNSIK